MKNFHSLVETQGALIDVRSNQYREDDDLDCILRDALRRNEAAAPDQARVLGLLRARLAHDGNRARVPWSLAAPGWTSSYMSASYWYLAPLTRFAR
jgi:hypothetical protein